MLCLQLCRSCGHAWKAGLFEGWRLFHNKDLEDDYLAEEVDKTVLNTYDIEKSLDVSMEEMSEQPEGNIDRDIWKNVALQYCHMVTVFKFRLFKLLIILFIATT